MITKDPVNSVHDEQFDAENKASESTGEETTTETGENDPVETAGMPADNTLPVEEVPVVEATEEDPVVEAAEEVPVVEAAEEVPVVEATEEDTIVEATEEDAVVDTLAEEALEVSASEETDEEAVIEVKTEETVESESTEEDTEESSEVSPEEKPVNYDLIVLPPVDYSGNSRKELIETLKLIVDNRPSSEIFEDVNRIKELFYKKTKTEFNEKRLNFAKEGGNIEDYKPEFDELENQMKGILEAYRSRKNDYNKVQEGEKQENLRKKHEIIENIKELVNREEAINKTFQEFRNLQNEWHSTGIVPQSALKDLWENYHHSVEIFYDYIKINRELRDLDLKRNLEAKIDLCEKAEELLIEPNAINAFKLLQEYHDQWREIGPVPHENKNDTWERFREATSKVNKRHHEFFEKQKDEQKRNLDAKTALCE
ncbi:MAG: DUF349 domain-containing protein, partial [Bacteroidales bacterium]|nr:DUF349 domain-containing protein [Bacteroidales bacterium]